MVTLAEALRATLAWIHFIRTPPHLTERWEDCEAYLCRQAKEALARGR